MTIPVCKYCGTPLLRWSWYEEPTEPVLYWYRFCCDKKEEQLLPYPANLGSYIVVLPRGAKEG